MGESEDRSSSARPSPPLQPRRREGKASVHRENDLRSILFMAGGFFLIAFWMHFPGMNPKVYSDLVDTLWPRISAAPGIVPYLDYKLEYPAISAIVLYASSLERNLYAFYLSMSAIILGCLLVTVALVYKLLKERGDNPQRIAYFIVFTPAFIYFSVYSFDWIGAVFMVASIFFAYRRRAVGSGLSIGLAAAARIIPVLLLPVLFLEFKSRKNRLLLLASASGAWLAVNSYFMLTNFAGFLYPYQFQSSFYAEDSWLNLASPYAKELSAALLLFSLALVLYKRRSFSLAEQSLLVMLAFVAVSYKFPPQYLVMLLPLFALTGVGYTEFMVANLLDVTLILWYFTPAFNLGSAVVVTSPVQWVAFARQFVLYLVFARLIARRGKPEAPTLEDETELEREIPIPQRRRLGLSRPWLPPVPWTRWPVRRRARAID